jgi:uncharacterized membrane protein YkvA (DUF1232 family)
MDKVIGTVVGLASTLPQVAKLVARLSRDKRVPVRAKRLAAALAIYAVLPFDLVPDLIPVVGVIDDLLALLIALAVLVEFSPKEVVVEHWDGGPQTLVKILMGVGLIMDFMPRRVRWAIRRLAGE